MADKKLTSRFTDEDLIYVLASRLHVKPEEAKETLSRVIDSIAKCLIENRELHIRKLGMFYLHRKKATRSRNFKGHMTIVEAYDLIRFKPAASIKEKIRLEGKTKLDREEL